MTHLFDVMNDDTIHFIIPFTWNIAVAFVLQEQVD